MSRKEPIIRDEKEAHAMAQDIAGQLLTRMYGNGTGRGSVPGCEEIMAGLAALEKSINELKAA
jgi:hypothetical protein